ncbi:thermonuclease family protein [Sinomonas atrocyanea]|uniref:thermonuclease family protein n=1 Tax=Sinomonas atrocyanea TaxID=37927 RepID=UPI003D98E97D
MLRTLAHRRALLPLALVGALAATGLAACSSDGSVDAKVVRVVDGDTFEAEYGGQTKTVRLLNVDTPETKHPNKIVECQGPEATRFLQEKLPAGKSVRLRFDQEGTDKYNRVLAATFLGEELVNASIARAGLGVAMAIAPNTKYYEQVKAAQDEAKAKKAGLFQDNLACSPEAVAQQLAASTATADPAADASSAAIAASAASLLTAISSARAGSDLFKDATDAVIVSAIGLSGLTKAEGKVTDALTKATARHKSLTDRAASVKAEEDRKAAEAAAEEKRKADEAAVKAGAEAEARAAAEAEAAARAAAAASQARAVPAQPAPAPQYVAPAPAPVQQNPYPGYTGPRCYAPGGKSWTPCPEKARR